MSWLSEAIGLVRDLLKMRGPAKLPKRVDAKPLPPKSAGSYSIQPDDEDTQPFGKPACKHTAVRDNRCLNCGRFLA